MVVDLNPIHDDDTGLTVCRLQSHPGEERTAHAQAKLGGEEDVPLGHFPDQRQGERDVDEPLVDELEAGPVERPGAQDQQDQAQEDFELLLHGVFVPFSRLICLPKPYWRQSKE